MYRYHYYYIARTQGDLYLYDPALLERLDFARSAATFRPPITAQRPGEPWLLVRPLRESDFDRGFLQLLGQLTAVGAVTRAAFLSKSSSSGFPMLSGFNRDLPLPPVAHAGRFAQMRQSGDYFVTVIEDTRRAEIIGAATLVLEHKFIHGCATRGRLEDVVVNDTYRGKQLGKL